MSVVVVPEVVDGVIEEAVEVTAVVSVEDKEVGGAAPAPITGISGKVERFLIRRLRFAWPRC